jgi:glutathione S-transferase
MIDLYTWVTPNGRKVSIMLAELDVPYYVHAVDIEKGGQFAPAFLAISPNNKIPAIRDRTTGLTLMESGTIPKRPAFEAYAARVLSRPAAIRAREIDDALVQGAA